MSTHTLEAPNRNNTQQSDRAKRPKNRGNFANDPKRAREAGRKGGRARGKSRPMSR